MRTLVMLASTATLLTLTLAVDPASLADTAQHTVQAMVANAAEQKATLEEHVTALKQAPGTGTPLPPLPPKTLPNPSLNDTTLVRKASILKAVLANKTAAYGGDTPADALHFWKEVVTQAGLEKFDDAADVALLPLAWADWAAGIKANGSAVSPPSLYEAKADAASTSATALALSHAGYVPPAVAAQYPGWSFFINEGAALADGGGYDWANPPATATGRRRLMAAPSSTVAICEPTGLDSFPPPLRGTVGGPAVCASAASPTIAQRGPEWFAATPPTNASAAASSTQTLYMLYLANLAYSAFNGKLGTAGQLFEKSEPCLQTQGFARNALGFTDFRVFIEPVPGPYNLVYATNSKVVAMVAHTTTDIFVALQGSDTASDFTGVNVRAWPIPTDKYTDKSTVAVHEGFHTAWQALAPKVLGAIDDISATLTGDWKVWLTGHSLGAALTTLAAAQYAVSRSADRVGGVYPFSSPRVGSARFTQAYNTILGDKTLLVSYGGDGVAMLPYRIQWNYQHVGRSVGLCQRDEKLEVAQVNALGVDAGDGCGNNNAAAAFASKKFSRHSPGLLWDALLRTVAGNGGIFSDGAARAACLGAALATCPGVKGAKSCAALLRCDAWLGTANQNCQSCATSETCGPAGTLYSGPWQNSYLGTCAKPSQVMGLSPTTCVA